MKLKISWKIRFHTVFSHFEAIGVDRGDIIVFCCLGVMSVIGPQDNVEYEVFLGNTFNAEPTTDSFHTLQCNISQ